MKMKTQIETLNGTKKRKVRKLRNRIRLTVLAAAVLALIPVFLLSYFAATAYPVGSVNITKAVLDDAMSYCEQYPVALKIDGRAATPDVPPVILNGRTLVPARAVFESMGAEVTWHEDVRQVEIAMGNTKLNLTIDSKTAIFNGSEVSLDVPPLIIEGRTMIPVRFVAESLGFKVEWDNAARIVEIEAPKIALEETGTPGAPADVSADVSNNQEASTDSGGESPVSGNDAVQPSDADERDVNVVYLPEALTAASLKNPSQSLQNFLNACSGKKVVFPEGRTYVLETQLVLHDISDLEIDFNGCTFKLPDNSAIPTRSNTGHYVPANTAIVVHDVADLTLSNYTIDGNKSNIPATTWCTGMAVMNAEGFTSVNGAFKNCNYHHIVLGPANVSSFNKDIEFYGTYFKDHGGAAGGAGKSDVYVNNRKTDDFAFIGVEVDNTSLKDYSTQAQCFYIAGFNGYFENVVTNNCAVPLDIRYGNHVAKDFYANNAERVLMVQPYPGGNGGNGYARVTASDFTGRNIKGGVAGGAAGVYVIGCDQCHLDDFDIAMDASSPYASYGIRVRKYYSEFPVNDVVVTNAIIKNFNVAGLIMEGLDTSTNFKNIELTSTGGSIYGVRTASCTAYQYLTGLVTSNCIEASSTDNMLKLL